MNTATHREIGDSLDLTSNRSLQRPIRRLFRAFTATLIGLTGCWLDVSTKDWIFNKLGPPPSRIWWFVEDFFGLQTAVNFGGLFGMGQGQTNVLAVVSIAALVAILCWLWLGTATSSWLLTVALGLMLAGVMGNLYDRLGYWGVSGVRDWILFRFGNFTWPNFNVADICLVSGACVLVLHSFQEERAAKQAQVAAQANETTARARTPN